MDRELSNVERQRIYSIPYFYKLIKQLHVLGQHNKTNK
jgi:hypothetical protein